MNVLTPQQALLLLRQRPQETPLIREGRPMVVPSADSEIADAVERLMRQAQRDANRATVAIDFFERAADLLGEPNGRRLRAEMEAALRDDGAAPVPEDIVEQIDGLRASAERMARALAIIAKRASTDGSLMQRMVDIRLVLDEYGIAPMQTREETEHAH